MPADPYRPQILIQLVEYGVFPRKHTDPALVRDHLKALYTMEVRILRAAQESRERSGDRASRREYAASIVALREKYAILSLPLALWTSSQTGGP